MKPIAYPKADKKKGKYKETFHANKKIGKNIKRPKTQNSSWFDIMISFD